MPVARPVLPDTPYLVTRRTTQRFFILRPDLGGVMQKLFLYLLAVVAASEGITVIAVTCLSTHYHLACVDPHGRLPVFFHKFHRALAMTAKCHRGWDEEVWNKSQTSRVELETSEALVGEISYLIANCVEAGIVRRVGRYPGVVTQVSEIGSRVIRIERPDNAWLVSEETWPEVAELKLEMPQALVDEYGLEGARDVLQDAVDERCRKAREARRMEGKGFVGAKRCMTAPIETRATQHEALVGRNPTFAVGAARRSAFFAAVEKLRAWRGAYAECLVRWRAGDRDVIWPAGTWLMVVLHGATAEDPPLE